MKKIVLMFVLFFTNVYSKIFIDGIGREVNIPDKVERVVSTAPANTEIILDMNFEDMLIGVDKKSSELLEKLKEKIIMKTNLLDKEKIIALNPDLVLVSEYNLLYGEEELNIFKQMKISVYVIKNPKTLKEVGDIIETVGKILNKEEIGKKYKKEYLDELEKLTNKTKNKKRVFFEIENEPIYTTGSGTFINDIIETAGGENIFKEEKSWFSPNLESVIKKNPQYILISKDRENEIENIKLRKEWKNIDAIKNSKIFALDESVNRGSKRVLIALKELKKILENDLKY